MENIDKIDTKNRVIWVEDNQIKILLKIKNEIFYTDYSKKLFDYLCNYNFSYYMKNKKLFIRCKIDEKWKHISFAGLIITFHMCNANRGSYVSAIKEYYKFTKNGLCVDHLNSNSKNNCNYNLSLMLRGINSSKSNLLAKISYPFIYEAVYINGKYRFCFGNIKENRYLNIITANAHEMVDFLQGFWKYGIDDVVTVTPEHIFYNSGKLLNGITDKIIIQKLLNVNEADFINVDIFKEKE